MKNGDLIKLYLLFLMISLLGSPTLFSQVNVSHVDNVSSYSGKQGVFYALPMTGIKFNVKVIKIQQFKGPYSEYAYRFLGLDNVITDNKKNFELVEVTLSTFTIPDPKQLYFVEFGAKQAKEDRNMMLALSQSGMVVKNTSNLSFDMPLSEFIKDEEICEGLQNEVNSPEYLFRYYATTNQVEKIDTIIRRIFLDTTVIEDISFKRSMVYKTLEQRAREAAEFIVEIRKNRFNLLTGYQEVDYDIETFQYMDRELLMMEEEYLSLFAGKSIKEDVKYSFTYVPSIESAGNSDILFKFSSGEGVMDATAAGGNPVKVDNVLLGLFSSQSNYEVFSRNSSNAGFAYRIPATVDMKVSLNGKTLAEKVLTINQLGSVGVMKVTDGIGIQFDPLTGRIVKVLLK